MTRVIPIQLNIMTFTENQKIKIKELFIDMKSNYLNVLSGECTIGDYQKLEEQFRLLGVSDTLSSDIYMRCGFDSWKSLHLERMKSSANQDRESVQCALGKLRGIYMAVKVESRRFLREHNIDFSL